MPPKPLLPLSLPLPSLPDLKALPAFRETVFSGLDKLPNGRAEGPLTEGALVLEGGGFRGTYTSGVLDAFMENGLNFSATVGVSAGAMNGLNYTARQIGRSARANLTYRHDSRYVGVRAFKESGSVIGFDFLLEDFNTLDPFDQEVFTRYDRRFVVQATNCLTGEAAYFENGKCEDIMRAVVASASMPFVSVPVEIDGVPYLDGGCAEKIPLRWAMNEGYEKIIVIKTRDAAYRADDNELLDDALLRTYPHYPAFAKALSTNNSRYNALLDEIDALDAQGRIYAICPSEPLDVSNLEGDMEKLGAIYYIGYRDGLTHLEGIRDYLKS